MDEAPHEDDELGEATTRVKSWDETWMDVARAVAQRSACGLAQVGAVVVNSTQRVVATGYNGPPQNWPVQCTTKNALGCPRYHSHARTPEYVSCISIHAEANALLFCDRKDRERGTMYVTRACCIDCAKLVANSGLRRVVMIETDDDVHREPWRGQTFMREAKVEVEVWQN